MVTVFLAAGGGFKLVLFLLGPSLALAPNSIQGNDSAKKTANVPDKTQAVFTGLLCFSCSSITDLWDRQSLIGSVSRNSWAG